MTNILYFSTINRDGDSVSSSARSDMSEPPHTAAQASPSVYTVIGNAWRALARPQLQVIDEENDNSTTASVSAAQFMITKRISYSELQICTSGFHINNKLGSGEFGSVFKGWIDEKTLKATTPGKGVAVAVKRIHQGRAEGVAEWLKDVSYLGRFDHPNLARTVGYCTEGHKRILVYEFMPGGSLEDHLFWRGSDSNPLSWSHRMRIALGAAKCIQFLHRQGARHRNIKPSNILLDSDYYPKLSFGVANGKQNFEEIETTSGPTMPPLDFVNVYITTHWISPVQTAGGDVYSFGVVLLELFIGRKVLQSELYDIRRRGEGELIPLFDKSLVEDPYALRDAKQAAGLVILCLKESFKYRKTMDHVVKCLTIFTSNVIKS